MIRIRFTMDSRRRGQVEHVRDLKTAARAIRCTNPKFTPERIHGFPKAWEVTCGDTVVADAMQLPRGARSDYFPKYRLSSSEKKRRRR